MILELNPLTMSEADAQVPDDREELKGLKEYFTSFTKLKLADAQKLRKELEDLNSIKLRQTHIVKLVDFLPKDPEAVHKVVNDVSLTEEEVAAILDVVKKY